MSLFAIVILSIIGSLFKGNSNTVMGTDEDPKDGGAVAGAVFGAVFIYIVCSLSVSDDGEWGLANMKAGILCVLRIPGLLTFEGKPTGCDKPVVRNAMNHIWVG